MTHIYLYIYIIYMIHIIFLIFMFHAIFNTSQKQQTIYSAILNAEGVYIEEIILVDDSSTMDNLGEKLEIALSYFKKPMVKLIRNFERMGLIQRFAFRQSNRCFDSTIHRTKIS